MAIWKAFKIRGKKSLLNFFFFLRCCTQSTSFYEPTIKIVHNSILKNCCSKEIYSEASLLSRVVPSQEWWCTKAKSWLQIPSSQTNRGRLISCVISFCIPFVGVLSTNTHRLHAAKVSNMNMSCLLSRGLQHCLEEMESSYGDESQHRFSNSHII